MQHQPVLLERQLQLLLPLDIVADGLHVPGITLIAM